MQILLIVIGMLLIIVNIGALKKDKKDFKSTFNNKKEGLNDYSVEIFKVRREFSETILEMQQEIESLKKEIKKLQNLKEEHISNAEIAYDQDNEYKDESVINEISNLRNNKGNNGERNKSVKVLEIHKLLEEGLTIDEIAEKMNISKGEALLIKELYIK